VLRRFAPLVVAFACWTGSLSAQPAPMPDQPGVEKPERSLALPSLFAVGLSVLILLVVCMPSRKA
jgi:hypothetical protein